MKDEDIEYLERMSQESSIGKTYAEALDFVFNDKKSKEEIVQFLEITIEQLCHNETKYDLINYIRDIISKEEKTPCLYKGLVQQHYTTLEEVNDWLSKQTIYYCNTGVNILDKPITCDFTLVQQKTLFNELIKSGFLSTDCCLDSFCYVFGGTIPQKNLRPLTWLKNKQLLRELLESVRNPNISKADMERFVSDLFINKETSPIVLAKNKNVPSVDSDKIKNLIESIFSEKNSDL